MAMGLISLVLRLASFIATEAASKVAVCANLLMAKIILAVQVFVPAAYLVGDHSVEMWIGQEAHKKM
jgi:hypothetical protein